MKGKHYLVSVLALVPRRATAKANLRGGRGAA
jgi:hypothetical protein